MWQNRLLLRVSGGQAFAEDVADPKTLIKQVTTQSIVAGLVCAALGMVGKRCPEFEEGKACLQVLV